MATEKHDIIRAAVQLELDGRKFYLDAAGKASNDLARQMFESLADDYLNYIEEVNGFVAESMNKIENGCVSCLAFIHDGVAEQVKDLELGGISEVLFELPGGDIIVLGSKSLRFIVLTTKNVLISGLEDFFTEAFGKTIEILGVE